MKIDLINLKQASASLTQQLKPIHEIECENGTITQDPEIWKQECHKFASDRFQDPLNDQANQIRLIKMVESEIECDKIEGKFHNDILPYDFMQAKASLKLGKAADQTHTVAEIIKYLPYKATTNIHKKFNTIYNYTNTTTKPHKPNNNSFG